nr:NUDIX domain-containing protein [Micromonospora sp. DSM 115978]
MIIRPTDPEPAGVDSLARTLAAYPAHSPEEHADLRQIDRLLGADNPWRRDLPLHFTASALIVHPATRRVLLRWHTRQRAWLQVGGHADPGETDPLVIAVREGREETGLTDLAPWPNADLVHLVVVPVAAGRGEPAHHHADLRFVLATATPDAARAETTEAEVRWLDLPAAHELVTEANIRETLTRLGRLFDRH